MARISIFLCSLALIGGVVGCKAPNEALANPTPPANNDAMIQQIQNDPNMPPDQKAAALGRLQQKAPVPKNYPKS